MCTKCGTENTNDSSFCTACGFLLNRTKSDTVNRAAAVLAEEPSEQTQDSRLRGVKGWLLLFCIVTTIVDPIGFLGEAAESKDDTAILLGVGFATLAVITGGSVWRVLPYALRLVKVYFVSLLCLGVFAILSSLPDHELARINYAGLMEAFYTLIFVALWWFYFRKSKRVKATFGVNL